MKDRLKEIDDKIEQTKKLLESLQEERRLLIGKFGVEDEKLTFSYLKQSSRKSISNDKKSLARRLLSSRSPSPIEPQEANTTKSSPREMFTSGHVRRSSESSNLQKKKKSPEEVKFSSHSSNPQDGKPMKINIDNIKEAAIMKYTPEEIDKIIENKKKRDTFAWIPELEEYLTNSKQNTDRDNTKKTMETEGGKFPKSN